MNDRLPAGRKPVGTAEATLVAERRAIVDELRKMAGGLESPYTSSSGFAFAFNSSSDRDAADVSAVAHDVRASLHAVFEQPFTVPRGPEPGPTQPIEPPADEELSTIAETPPVPGPGGEAGSGSDTSAGGPSNGSPAGARDVEPPSVEQLLSQPAGVTSRELVERANRALEKQWNRDAERLFFEATKSTPTDPFPWFGAGLAARTRDERQAAAYLMRAARYLVDDDPSGAVYTAIMATELLESIGQDDTARRTLERFARDLPQRCPAISLHLARLEIDSATRVREAIDADPMLEADVVALGIDVGHVAVDSRLQATRKEIHDLDEAIGRLGRVGGIAPNPPLAPERHHDPDDRLPLAWAEVNLWQRLELCEREVDEARRRLEERELAREEAEELEAEKAQEASRDLQAAATFPFFLFSLATSASVLVTYALGRWLSTGSPRFAAPISLAMWFVILCLLVVAFSVLSAIWRPFPEIAKARQAKEELPVHEYLVARRRYDEILVRRSYERASQQAELVMGRTIGRRTVIVPRRPEFRASDLPVVPARR